MSVRGAEAPWQTADHKFRIIDVWLQKYHSNYCLARILSNSLKCGIRPFVKTVKSFTRSFRRFRRKRPSANWRQAPSAGKTGKGKGMRSLFLLILVVVFYYSLKSIFISFKKKGDLSGGTRDRNRVDDMVKDPSCETYILKSNALTEVFRGERFYFCSEECLEKFRKKNSAWPEQRHHTLLRLGHRV